MKYNYIILGSEWDLYQYSYSDLFAFDNVTYIPGIRGNLGKLETILFNIHFSSKINKLLFLPQKNRWSSRLVRTRYDNNNPLCFVFFTNWVVLDAYLNLVEYLRKSHPNCKIVWFTQDLLSKQFTDQQIREIKQKFDLLISFDIGECKKYNFYYHPLVFSEIDIEDNSDYKTDLFFLGKAKDRLNLIYSIHDRIEQETDLKMKFFLVGVHKKQRIRRSDIFYIDSMPYIDNLKFVKNTKILLEIMQKDGTGFTQRGAEAVCLNKCMVTNNRFVKDEPFFNDNYISIFSNEEDLDLTFLKDRNKVVNYHYKKKMSPKELLRFIEQKLS